jgi:hypothetical protein
MTKEKFFDRWLPPIIALGIIGGILGGVGAMVYFLEKQADERKEQRIANPPWCISLYKKVNGGSKEPFRKIVASKYYVSRGGGFQGGTAVISVYISDNGEEKELLEWSGDFLVEKREACNE